MILKDSLNIDKNLTQHEIHLTAYKCEHRQQNILKTYCFSSSKLHKGVNIKIQISKLKNQSSAFQTICGSKDGNFHTCCISKVLRYFSRNSPILQVFAHHIPDKLAVSFNSSSSLLSSYKWFLTIGSKYSFVKAYNMEISFF